MDFLESILRYHRVVIISVIFLSLFALIDRTLAIGVILFTFLVSVTLFFIDKVKERETAKILTLLFLIVFLIHALFVVAIHYTKFQPFSEGRGDFNEYHSVARQISERVRSSNFSLKNFDEFPNLVNYYPVIVGYLYLLTTPNMLMGQLLNAWIVALIAIFIFFIVKELGRSEKEGLLVGLMAGVYPSLLFYGSLLLKDALVVLLAIIGLLLSLKIIKNFSWKIFLIFYLTLIGTAHLRFYVAYALVLNFIIFWSIFSRLKIKNKIICLMIMIVLFGFLPFSALDGKTQGYMGLKAVNNFLNPQTIASYRDLALINQGQTMVSKTENDLLVVDNQIVAKYSLIAQDSSVRIDINFNNPVLFFKSIFLSFIYVVLGPLPWHLTHKKHLFVLSEMITWYFLLFFIVRGIAKSISKEYRIIFPVLFFSLLILGVLTFYMNNFGIVTRIRMPAFLALLCLLPFGIPSEFSQKFFENFKLFLSKLKIIKNLSI